MRYTGCEMEVLTRCTVRGSYKYTPVTLQSERITIHDADDLYAQIPIGAAKLEGELEKSGQLNVDTSIVGTFDAAESIARDDLNGDCERATHVLTSLTVGAFEFYSGAAVSAGGGVGAFGMGAGGKSRSERTLLTRSGTGEACKSSRGEDERPPEGCGALLRVEATPIAAARQAKTAPIPEAPPPESPPEAPAPESPEPEASTEPTRPVAAPFADAPSTSDTSDTYVAGPPPPRGDLTYAPGFLLGVRGPFGIHVGNLEQGVSLGRYMGFAAGATLEIGYRLSSVFSLVGTGTAFAGTPAQSSDDCPTGVKCRGRIFSGGADLVVTPYRDERLWLGLGAEYSYIIIQRDGDFDDDAGAAHTLDMDRRYAAVGPRISIGRDFADSYVPWIQYGFMLSYSLRAGISASGKNDLDGQNQPLSGKPGITHTILFLGRFHFDTGLVPSDPHG